MKQTVPPLAQTYGLSYGTYQVRPLPEKVETVFSMYRSTPCRCTLLDWPMGALPVDSPSTPSQVSDLWILASKRSRGCFASTQKAGPEQGPLTTCCRLPQSRRMRLSLVCLKVEELHQTFGFTLASLKRNPRKKQQISIFIPSQSHPFCPCPGNHLLSLVPMFASQKPS